MIRRALHGAVRLAFTIAGILVVLNLLRSRLAPAGETSTSETRPSRYAGILKRWVFRTVVVLTTAGFAGAIVVVSGIVPIKASSGHWAVTAWFLQFAKRRSVATHTIGLRAPALDDPGLVLKGAGHYDLGCRPCHGSPGSEQPRIAAHMTPRPPSLRTSSRRYGPEELFYIVRHGIKLTGMPAWPSQHREDEVWAMVAFLRVLPDLDPPAYRRLVDPANAGADAGMAIADLIVEPGVPRAIAETCSRCHGTNGLGGGAGAFPKLAGQRVGYLHATLEAYASGERHSGIMEPIAAGLTPEQAHRIAQYYGDLREETSPGALNESPEIERGRGIARGGLPDQLVPPCSTCHGPGGGPRNPNYPALAGQYADYIALQLSLFKSDRRGGTAYRDIMRRVASGLTDDQMRAVALYYASLNAEPGSRTTQGPR